MFNNDYLADIYADSSKSIVSINVKELTDQLELNPFIKAVRISKKYPRKIEVNIVEREPIAIINNSTKILIDEDAIVMPNNHYAQKITPEIVDFTYGSAPGSCLTLLFLCLLLYETIETL